MNHPYILIVVPPAASSEAPLLVGVFESVDIAKGVPCRLTGVHFHWTDTPSEGWHRDGEDHWVIFDARKPGDAIAVTFA